MKKISLLILLISFSLISCKGGWKTVDTWELGAGQDGDKGCGWVMAGLKMGKYPDLKAGAKIVCIGDTQATEKYRCHDVNGEEMIQVKCE